MWIIFSSFLEKATELTGETHRVEMGIADFGLLNIIGADQNTSHRSPLNLPVDVRRLRNSLRQARIRA